MLRTLVPTAFVIHKSLVQRIRGINRLLCASFKNFWYFGIYSKSPICQAPPNPFIPQIRCTKWYLCHFIRVGTWERKCVTSVINDYTECLLSKGILVLCTH